MNILVTGSKGFIGKNLIPYLSSYHHNPIGVDVGDGVDLDGIEMVIHLGAITSTTCTDSKALYQNNYLFTVDLINKCSQKRIPIQIASSASVYGIHNTTFVETDTPAPANPYAWSKLLVEEYCKNKKFPIPVQLFRYFNVHGPMEEHKGDQASPYHKFEQQAQKGEVTLFEGSENYLRDFIHVSEICELHQRFFKVKESGIWNFGTGQCLSFETVAQIFKQKYNCNINYIPVPENLKNSYQPFTKANMFKTFKTLKKYEA